MTKLREDPGRPVIEEQLDRLIEAVRSKQTIVPIFVFVPQQVRPEELRHIAEHMTKELRRAGFDLPDRPEGGQ